MREWQDIRFSGRANEQNVIKYDGIEGSGIIDASPGVANGENITPFKAAEFVRGWLSHGALPAGLLPRAAEQGLDYRSPNGRS